MKHVLMEGRHAGAACLNEGSFKPLVGRHVDARGDGYSVIVPLWSLGFLVYRVW